MKKIALLVLVVLTAFGTVSAQRRNRQKIDPQQRVEKQVKSLDQKLDLSDEQEQKIEALYKDFFSQKYTREQRKVKKEDLNKNIEQILTEEQRQIFLEQNKNKGKVTN